MTVKVSNGGQQEDHSFTAKVSSIHGVFLSTQTKEEITGNEATGIICLNQCMVAISMVLSDLCGPTLSAQTLILMWSKFHLPGV